MPEMLSKSQLKARLLNHLRRVEETGEELVVTDHGKPVLRVVPYEARRRTFAEAFSAVRGRVPYSSDDDIVAPTLDEWPET